MKRNIHVKASPNSILNNILQFFRAPNAFMQETLQNARRAEASRVTVTVDSKTKSVTITDNGHGVIDPEDLVNIGKSEWNDQAAKEQPAGMGLFSLFKLGNLVTIRSGTWSLRMDYAKMKAGKHAVYTGLLPKIEGTSVIIQELSDSGLSEAMNMNMWRKTATFMPFKTTITINDVEATVDPFNPRVTPDGALRVEAPWGHVYICTKPATSCGLFAIPNYHGTKASIIQQGVCLPVPDYIQHPHYNAAPVHLMIYTKPGTVRMALPDRDALINDEALTDLIKDVERRCVERVIDYLPPCNDRRMGMSLANIVYACAPERVTALPPAYQSIHITCSHYYDQPVQRNKLEELIRDGAIITNMTGEHNWSGLEGFFPCKLVRISKPTTELFKKMFPNTPVADRINLHIEEDIRGTALWHCTKITVCCCENVKEITPIENMSATVTDITNRPEKNESAVLVTGHNAHDVMEQTEDGVIVIHTCRDRHIVDPDLTAWFELHSDSDVNPEDLWEYSDTYFQVQDTWDGIDARNLTLDKLVRALELQHRLVASPPTTELVLTDMEIVNGLINKVTAIVRNVSTGAIERQVKLTLTDWRLRVLS